MGVLVSKFPLQATWAHIIIMNMKVAGTVAAMACAMESAVGTFILETVAATGTTSVLSLGVGTATLTAGTAGALALTGGLVLLKGLALAAIVASRSRRAAVAVDETDCFLCFGCPRTCSMLPSFDLRFGHWIFRKIRK